MSEARKRVLTMLAEGKITVEQSEELLKALDADQQAQAQAAAQAETGKKKGSTLGADVSQFAQQFQEQMREAMKNIEPHTKEIKTKLKGLGTWIQGAVGEMAKDFTFDRYGPPDGLEVEFVIHSIDGVADCRLCEMNNPFGTVTFKEGDVFRLLVKGKISKMALNGEPPMDWFKGNLLSCKNGVLFIGFDKAAGFKASLNLEVTLPTSVKLRVKSASANLKVVGPFNIESILTISGDISLVKTMLEECPIETVSGDIELIEGRASISAKTTSGKITLSNVEADKISAQTVSGNISIERPGITEKTTFELISTSGDLMIKRPNGPIGRVDASTRTGFLQMDWGSGAKEPFQHGITMEMSSTGASFKLETISGDITLD